MPFKPEVPDEICASMRSQMASKRDGVTDYRSRRGRDSGQQTVGEDRCPECGAWYGAWRGATWHSDGCPNHSKPDPTLPGDSR